MENIQISDITVVASLGESILLCTLNKEIDNPETTAIQYNLGNGTFAIDKIQKLLKFTPFEGLDVKDEVLQDFLRNWIYRKLPSEKFIEALVAFTPEEETTVQKAILAGIIPVGLISKALNKDYKKLLLQIKERQGKLEKSDFLEVWRKFNTSKNREGIEEFNEYTNHYNLKDLPFWPQGLDLENCEVVYIDKEKVTVIAGGDWQDGKYVTISLANSSNGEGLELEVIGVSDEKPKGQTARERQKFYKENGLSKFETVDVEKAYLLGLIPDDLIEKAWKKQPIGTVTTRKDGQQYRKVAETGNMDQDWKLVVKDKGQSGEPEAKGDSKPEEKVKKQKQATPDELKVHAKETSELALKNAIQSSSDSDVRTAAQNELDRREKKEKPQEPEKPKAGEKKAEPKVVKKTEKPENKLLDAKQKLAKKFKNGVKLFRADDPDTEKFGLDSKGLDYGSYWTSDKKEAEGYLMEGYSEKGRIVHEAKVTMENAFVVTEVNNITDWNFERDDLEKEGYDGIAYEDKNGDILAFPFHNKNIEKEDKPIKKGGFEQWL